MVLADNQGMQISLHACNEAIKRPKLKPLDTDHNPDLQTALCGGFVQNLKLTPPAHAAQSTRSHSGKDYIDSPSGESFVRLF